jgi:hypothetical protein
MLMRPNNCRIEQQFSEVGLLQLAEDGLPHTCFRPTVETLKCRVPAAKTRGKVAPRGARSSNPDDRVDEQPIVRSASPRIPLASRKETLDPVPLFVRKFVASAHAAASMPGTELVKSQP